MDLRQKHEIILRGYEHLTLLLKPILACRTAHLQPNFLQDNDIIVSHLDWHPENAIDFEPLFCEPYPIATFEQLFRRTKATNYWGTSTRVNMRWVSEQYEEVGDESTRRMQKSYAASRYLHCHIGYADEPQHMASKGDWLTCCTGRKLYKPRGSCFGDDRSPSVWAVQAIMRSLPWPQIKIPEDKNHLWEIKRKLIGVRTSDLPIALDNALQRPGRKSLVHMAIINHDDSDINEQLVLRSDLIAAICIIRDGMRQRKYIEQHAVYPVFVYSWSAFDVRVLQVHFDLVTKKLMVRKTSYIQIDGPHRQDEIKLMLRWMMNVPKGETRWEDLDIANKVSLNDSNSADKPPSPKKPSVRCS